MKTVKGGEIDLNMSVIVEPTGGGINLPQSWEDITDPKWYYNVPAENQMYIYTFRPDDSNKLSEVQEAVGAGTATREEYREVYYNAVDNGFPLYGIYTRDAKEQSSLFSDSDFGTRFAYAEKIGTFAGNDYYFVYNDTLPSEGYTDEELSQIQMMLDSRDEVKDGVMLFPPHEHDDAADQAKANEKASAFDFSSFTVTDLNGNTVTQDIFKDYDITMINLWKTDCPYCREEMPDIEKVYQNLPENANIISICKDAAEEREIVDAIVDKTGITFSVLVPDDDMIATMTAGVLGYPTTIFVDSEGHMVGDVVPGAPGGDIAQTYQDLINKYLGQ